MSVSKKHLSWENKLANYMPPEGVGSRMNRLRAGVVSAIVVVGVFKPLSVCSC